MVRCRRCKPIDECLLDGCVVGLLTVADRHLLLLAIDVLNSHADRLAVLNESTDPYACIEDFASDWHAVACDHLDHDNEISMSNLALMHDTKGREAEM